MIRNFPFLHEQSNRLPVRDFQVFGERCSGTNFLEHLIVNNFRERCVYHYGWKHGIPMMPAIWPHSLILVIVREPVEWLLSLHRTPYEAYLPLIGCSFSEFIRQEWEAESRPGIQGWEKWGMRQDGKLKGEIFQLDRHPLFGRRFVNALEMRTVKAQAMLGFRHRAGNLAILRFEDLLTDPALFLTSLGKCFQLRSKRTNPDLTTERVDPKAARLRPRLTADQISAVDMNFIRGNLDPSLETGLGYWQDRE